MKKCIILLFIAAALALLGASLWYLLFRPTKPTMEQLEAFRGANSVCVQVEQTYYYDNKELKGFTLPFEDIAKRSLSYAGLRVVANDTDGCDAVLRVNAKGRTPLRCKPALSSKAGSYACYYADASVSGEVSLQVNTLKPYKKSFKGSHDEMAALLSARNIYLIFGPDAPRPTDAPWETAFSGQESSFPARILLMVGEIYGAQPLQACLNDENEIIRLYAAWALGEIGDTGSIDALVVALENDECLVRKRAAEALGKLHWKAQSNAQQISYLMASDKWDQIVRKYDEEAIGPLVAALKDEEYHVRYRAAEALGKIGDPSAVAPLINALRDEDEFVRSQAAKALGEIGPEAREAVPVLIDALLRDEEEYVGWATADALKDITGQDFGGDAARWQQWWEKNK
ncbi:MAG: hypothetical protein A2Y60_01920 [Chloroflexi bacterium RBG_13_54_9]|nr:MAG: hypothetical protein A2Y60_01920 [Chloroflexi bacterium RBG_13_54_9]